MNINNKDLLVIRNDNLEVTLSPKGASIYRIRFFNKDMILTTKNSEDFYREDIYFGKTIGRVAGRIVKDNKIMLHGGKEGFSNCDFSVSFEGNKVVFTYLSKDGESGFEGNVNLQVTYEIRNTFLLVNYRATTDKPTLLCLTNHSYFCLGESSINDLCLKMNSKKYIVTNDVLLPIKLETINDKYNFTSFSKVLKDGDIDNSFLLEDKKVELKSSRFSLLIESDFEAVQVFTDHFDLNVETITSDAQIHRAIAIEPQDNQLNRKVLTPNEIYERNIRYKFTKL